MTNRAEAGRASGHPERSGLLHTPDGRDYAWSEWGPANGRPVLLQHGSPGSSHACPDVAATHAAGARLIAPDRPGFGDSTPHPGRTLSDDAADAARLLDHLGVSAAAVVGWSSGGAFALALGAHHPDRVTTIALVASDAPPDERALTPGDEKTRARIDLVRADPAAARVGMMERGRWFATSPTSILEDADEQANAVVDRLVRDPDAELRRERPDVRAMLVEMFEHAARHGQSGWVDDSIALQLPWTFALADIERPVTVWFGALDRLAARDDSELLASRIPGARLIVLPDDGHSLPMRHWPAILDSVLAGSDGSLGAG